MNQMSDTKSAAIDIYNSSGYLLQMGCRHVTQDHPLAEICLVSHTDAGDLAKMVFTNSQLA